MNRKFALLGAASLVAFANAAPQAGKGAAPAAPGTNAPTAPTAAAESASKRRERKDVTVLTGAAPMSLPQSLVKSRRGKGSKYDFDGLAAPIIDPNGDNSKNQYHSFGLTGMDKKGFNSTLFSANGKYKKLVNKVDGEGKPVMKPGPEIKDAAGNVVGHGPSTEPEKIEVIEREFIAVEVDPKTDKEGASLRIFRIK